VESFYVYDGYNKIERQCRECHYFQWHDLYRQKCSVECEFKYRGDILRRKVFYMFVENRQ